MVSKGFQLVLKGVDLYLCFWQPFNGSLHFLWKVPLGASEELVISKNTEVIRRLQPSLPVFHTRAMKKQFYHDVQIWKTIRFEGNLS